MAERSSESDAEMSTNITMCSEGQGKKRRKYGRMIDVAKKIRLQSHETGEDCKCKRLKCFENVPPAARQSIISNFNLLKSTNEQNIYLCGLISVHPVQRRRPRVDETSAKLHDGSFSYKVRFSCDDETKEIPVCYKAFLSLHGIKKKKLEVLQSSLKMAGIAPIDRRGKHSNRANKLDTKIKDAIIEHIKSFKGRQSHYSIKKTSKLYLPEELNIKKMYKMFIEQAKGHVSYETYRQIFSKYFNISFGYPRSDTCSSCDEFLAKIKSLQARTMTTSGDERNQIRAEIRRLETSNKLHKLKALQFYKRKKVAKFASRTDETREAICMDFAKNLPVPNITTNDVYYKRQLSVYSFNIHVLSTAQSIFYVYPETVGGKGSDAVCSMLHHFLNNFLDHRVKNLEIFCDSCGGQNKNYTLFRYIHHLVHFQGKLNSVKVSFPIRGHSYMECDKDFGLIKQKTVVELPSEWIQVFRSSRVKPSPFDVLQVTQCYFRSWTTHMTSLYRKQCPFKTRPVRELRVVKDHPRFVLQRATWNGMWESNVIIDGRKLPLDTHEFELPGYLYKGMLPISAEKFKDLQCLKRFCCNPEADEFYSTLPHNQKSNNSDVGTRRKKRTGKKQDDDIVD